MFSGLVREVDDNGNPEPGYKKDRLGLPNTTLNYTNGRGYPGATNEQPKARKNAVKS